MVFHNISLRQLRDLFIRKSGVRIGPSRSLSLQCQDVDISPLSVSAGGGHRLLVMVQLAAGWAVTSSFDSYWTIRAMLSF